MGKSKKLIIHIMENLTNEVGRARAKVYSQEFTWKKRMWAIDSSAIAWVDTKGVSHYFVDVNESDGTIRFLHAQKDNIIDNKCTACNGKISIDAKNTWDLLKRKTINTFWGVDSSHIVLLIIMGIVAISAVAGIMYLLGQNTKLTEQYTKLLERQSMPTPPAIVNMILGLMI